MHGGSVAIDYLRILLIDLGRWNEELNDVYNGSEDDE